MAIDDPKKLSEINRLIEEYNQKRNRGVILSKEENEQYDRLIIAKEKLKKLSDQLIESHRKEIATLEEYLAKLEGIAGTTEGNLLRRQVEVDLLKENLSLAQEIVKSGGKITPQQIEQVKNLEDQLSQQQEVLSVQEELNKGTRQQTSLVQAAGKAGAKLALMYQDSSLALGAMNVGAQKLGGFLTGKFLDGFKSMIFSFDESTKAFERQFAVGSQYRDMLEQVYTEQVDFGVSMEDTSKAAGELITSFTDFTMLLPSQRTELIKTANVLQKSYGIANADFSKGIQTSTKMLGMNTSSAKGYQEELAETAKALGVAPAQLTAQFAQMGPQLAKFGFQGGKAFKELARIQKLTGMEMSKVLNLTNQFDTFEGAATAAGQLNAALGGNFVNAMDMMMATDPVERFNMMRDAIMSTGLTFDDMSYYQKQFYTNALG